MVEETAREQLYRILFLTSIQAACFNTATGSVAYIALNFELKTGSSLCKIMHAVVVVLSVST